MADGDKSKKPEGKLIKGFAARRQAEKASGLTLELRAEIPKLPTMQQVVHNKLVHGAVIDFNNLAADLLPSRTNRAELPPARRREVMARDTETVIQHLASLFPEAWDEDAREDIRQHQLNAEAIAREYSFNELPQRVDATMSAAISYMHKYARNDKEIIIVEDFETLWREGGFDSPPLKELYGNTLTQVKLEQMRGPSR